MLIVGDNLRKLMGQYSIVETLDTCFDETSISLRLDFKIIQIKPQNKDVLTFGENIPPDWINEKDLILEDGIIIEPHESLLGCSYEIVNIPNGYFGLLQTKSSLSRLFISIHCCASQIEPGFQGKITFEIYNNSNLRIRLLPKQNIASLYIFKTSGRSKPYKGRYNQSETPIIQLPLK